MSSKVRNGFNLLNRLDFDWMTTARVHVMPFVLRFTVIDERKDQHYERKDQHYPPSWHLKCNEIPVTLWNKRSFRRRARKGKRQTQVECNKFNRLNLSTIIFCSSVASVDRIFSLFWVFYSSFVVDVNVGDTTWKLRFTWTQQSTEYVLCWLRPIAIHVRSC